MFEFTYATWLLALVFIPLVWWIHRRSESGQRILVSSILFWPQQSVNNTHQQRKRKAPIIWLLRATILALLLLALSFPQTVSDQREIQIWLDDSASMLTIEKNMSRFEAGLQQLKELTINQNTKLIFHSLTQPQEKYTAVNEDISTWRDNLHPWITAQNHQLQLPVHPKLPGNTEHWLITDGSDDRINDWASSMPFYRIIQPGAETENVAVELIAARRNLQQSTKPSGIAIIKNSGNSPVSRKLEISQLNNRETIKLELRDISIPPKEEIPVNFEFDYKENYILQATLHPEDALTIDDSLRLETRPLATIKVHIEDSCPYNISLAVKSHPLMKHQKTAGGNDINIQCSTPPEFARIPTLFFDLTAKSELNSPAVWLPDAPQELLRFNIHMFSPFAVNAQNQHNPLQTPVLASANKTLISYQRRPAKLVYVHFNIASGPAKHEMFPLFLLQLIEFTLNKPITDMATVRSMPETESDIQPKRQLHASGTSVVQNRDQNMDLSAVFVLAALLLLFTEIVLLVYRHPRKRVTASQ